MLTLAELQQIFPEGLAFARELREVFGPQVKLRAWAIAEARTVCDPARDSQTAQAVAETAR